MHTYSQKLASATAYMEPKMLAYRGKYSTYSEKMPDAVIQPKEANRAPGRLAKKP